MNTAIVGNGADLEKGKAELPGVCGSRRGQIMHSSGITTSNFLSSLAATSINSSDGISSGTGFG